MCSEAQRALKMALKTHRCCDPHLLRRAGRSSSSSASCTTPAATQPGQSRMHRSVGSEAGGAAAAPSIVIASSLCYALRVQSAIDAMRHAQRSRDDAEARAAGLEGRLLASQREAARSKADALAVRY